MKKTITLLAAGLILAGSAQAQLMNTDMELWHTYTSGPPNVTLESPNGWYGLDSTLATFGIILGAGKKQVYKSTDKHGGTYAAALVSRSYTGFGVVPGILSNAHIAVDLATQDYVLSGGTPVTQRIGTVSAWVKYVPKGNDSGVVGAFAVIQGIGAGGADSVIGEGFTTFGAINNYTQMTVPITYINNTQIPTHIQFGFISGNLDNGVDSSVLYVDDVSMTVASGISQQLVKNKIVSCYPNPASNTLYLSTNEAEKLIWEAVSANGQLVASKEFTKTATVSLNDLPSGTYFFRVLNMNKEMIQTGKFVVTK